MCLRAAKAVERFGELRGDASHNSEHFFAGGVMNCMAKVAKLPVSKKLFRPNSPCGR